MKFGTRQIRVDFLASWLINLCVSFFSSVKWILRIVVRIRDYTFKEFGALANLTSSLKLWALYPSTYSLVPFFLIN